MSTPNDGDRGVWWEMTVPLSVSLGWSSVRQRESLLLRHLSGSVLDPEWWVSTQNDEDDGLWWEETVAFTWLFFSASASDLAPSSPIWLSDRCRVVSVYTNFRDVDMWMEKTDTLTWFIWSTSVSDRTPSPPIRLCPRSRVVSVYTKWWRWWCVMVQDCRSHSVDRECIGQWLRSVITYPVFS